MTDSTLKDIETWFQRNKRWIYPAVWFIIGGATGGTAFNADRIWEYLPSDPTVQVSIEDINGSLDKLDIEIENLKTAVEKLESSYSEIDSKVDEIEKHISNNDNELTNLKSDLQNLKNSGLSDKTIEDLSTRISKLEAWHSK